MARICDKCHRCHTGYCPKPPTLKQVRKEVARFIKVLNKAENAASKSTTRYGDADMPEITGVSPQGDQ